MASTKPGPAINLREEAEDGGAAVDVPIFVSEGQASSLLVRYSHRDVDCNPYFPFSGSISDSGSDLESDPYSCPIDDIFDRESSDVDDPAESEELTGDDFNIWGFYDPKEEDDEEIVLGTGFVSGTGSDQQPGDSAGEGLRVTGIDSDSDYEDGVFDFNSADSGNGANDSGRVEVGTGLPPLWDYVYGEESLLAAEEWEEVQNAINWPFRVFSGSEEEGEDDDEEEELSSPSRDDDSDEEEHQLDWQVLLTVNNVVNYIEQAEGIMINPDDIDPNYYLYLASLDEYDENHNGHYDDVLGQMLDNEIGVRGNPPAAKRVIEDLPVVELTVEEVNKGNVVCAVCKDDMVVEEKVRSLPCKHLYHGECIVPWLGIRNTCPVCRYELPTDDLDYERHRRSQRSEDSLSLTG